MGFLFVLMLILIIYFWCKDRQGSSATESKTNQGSRSTQPMDRLTKDGKLPFGWIYQNKSFTDPLKESQSILIQQISDTWYDSPRRHLSALETYIMFMQNTEDDCRNKGECFLYWYNEYFAVGGYQEYIDRCKEYQENIVQLDSDYMRKKTIQKEIIQIIKANPHILQTEVYKKFAPEEKGIVSNELYQFAASGKIVREKSGRTYSLTIK